MQVQLNLHSLQSILDRPIAASKCLCCTGESTAFTLLPGRKYHGPSIMPCRSPCKSHRMIKIVLLGGESSSFCGCPDPAPKIRTGQYQIYTHNKTHRTSLPGTLNHGRIDTIVDHLHFKKNATIIRRVNHKLPKVNSQYQLSGALMLSPGPKPQTSECSLIFSLSLWACQAGLAKSTLRNSPNS